MAITTRRENRYPVGATAPPDVPAWMLNLATDLDDVALHSQGTLAGRPAVDATPGHNIGVSGSIYGATDTLQAFLSTGAAWWELVLGTDTRLTNTRTPTDGSVTAAKLAAGALNQPIVAALPGTPADGDECLLQTAAMAALNTVWHLRYRAGSPGSYKWEFIGGPPLAYNGGSLGAPLGNSAVPFAFGGNTLAIPVAGKYEMQASCRVTNGISENRETTLQIFVNGVAVGDQAFMRHAGAYSGGNLFTACIATAAAAGSMDARGMTTAVQNITFHYAQLMLRPVALG